MKASSHIELTTPQAAEILGVHESTVKRWCNENEMQCAITHGGHRRIALNVLLSFAQKNNIKTPYALYQEHAARVFAAFEEIRSSGSYENLTEFCLECFEKDDFVKPSAAFLQLLEDSGRSYAEIFDQFFYTLQHEVGRRWESGSLDVAVEHYISHVIDEALQAASVKLAVKNQLMFPEQKRPAAVIGCAEGNWHVFAVKCVEILLLQAGYQVYNLGISVPYADLITFQKRFNASLVAVSFARPQGMSDVKRAVEILTAPREQTAFELHIGGGFVEKNSLSSVQISKASFYNSTAPFEEYLKKKDLTK